MCRFTRPVRSVSKTKIFARDAGDEKQVLVYAMTLSTDEELAMVLALPVRSRGDETAVRFIDLSHYPGFFVASIRASARGQGAPRAVSRPRRARPSPWSTWVASKRPMCPRLRTSIATILAFACRRACGISRQVRKISALPCSSSSLGRRPSIRWHSHSARRSSAALLPHDPCSRWTSTPDRVL